jgi:hypothetical protein
MQHLAKFYRGRRYDQRELPLVIGVGSQAIRIITQR